MISQISLHALQELKKSIPSKLSVFQMQGTTEMVFSLPYIKNLPAFYENMKFGDQNMILNGH